MNQPELGRRIAELRRAKGFTQEELIEKCNLSVRTLQRIESGEVTPRISTIKLIYAALDYTEKDITERSGSKLLDWFNLKSNTVKKVAVLTSLFFAACIVVILTQEGQAQKNDQVDPENKIVFRNYSSTITHSDKEELFGYQVRFDCDGVHMYSRLFKIDKKTREFKSGVLNGKLLPNKVEIHRSGICQEDDKKNFTYKNIEQLVSKTIFKGGVVIVSNEDTIKAEEIVVFYK